MWFLFIFVNTVGLLFMYYYRVALIFVYVREREWLKIGTMLISTLDKWIIDFKKKINVLKGNLILRVLKWIIFYTILHFIINLVIDCIYLVLEIIFSNFIGANLPNS